MRYDPALARGVVEVALAVPALEAQHLSSQVLLDAAEAKEVPQARYAPASAFACRAG